MPDFDLDKKQEFVREIFIRLHSFDSNSINLCLKTLYLLTQERDGIDVRIYFSGFKWGKFLFLFRL